MGSLGPSVADVNDKIRGLVEPPTVLMVDHFRMTTQPGSGDLLRQRTRTVTAFCYSCNTPWTLTCEYRDGVWVVFCTQCGTVRPPRNDLVEQIPWS